MIPIGLNRPLYGDPPTDEAASGPRSGASTSSSRAAPGTGTGPIVAGDQLYSFGGTESVVEKESEFAERSVLVTYASVKMNQRAEIVAISRTLAIHTERKTAREKGKYADIEPATYTDERPRRDRRDLRRRGAPAAPRPRWWEDVERRRGAARRWRRARSPRPT